MKDSLSAALQDSTPPSLVKDRGGQVVGSEQVRALLLVGDVLYAAAGGPDVAHLDCGSLRQVGTATLDSAVRSARVY